MVLISVTTTVPVMPLSMICPFLSVYGEIRTHDREIDMDSELGKAVGRAERCKEKLAALLEGEAKALLLRLIDADSEISNTLALENFIQGFRLGMRLAMEGLDEAEGVDRA